MKKFNLNNLKRFFPLFIILVGASLYYPVLGFQYVWDDNLLFVEKVSLLNEPLSWALVSEPVLFGTSYFRPLVFLSWFLEFRLWGQVPAISHSINLVFFLANSLMVYVLARQLLSQAAQHSITKPLLASLFYACHPVLIESTAWVSGRFDLFATFFIFLASITFLSEKVSVPIKTLVIFLSSLCALMSKELGVVIPVVLFFLWMARYGVGKPLNMAVRQFWLQNKVILIFIVLAFGVYFFLRLGAMGSVYHREFNAYYVSEAYFSDFLPFKAFLFYAYRVFLPFLAGGALHPYESYYASSASILASVVITVLVIGFFIRGVLRKSNPGYWVFGAGLICAFLVLHLIPLSIGENLGHDRFLTASLGFFAISICYPDYVKLFASLRVREKLAKALVFIVVLFWFLLVFLTHTTLLKVWSDEFSLWRESYRLYPELSAAKYNYVYSAMKSGRFDVAEKILLEARDAKGFETSEQALYADLLVRKSDPEALLYLEGLLSAFPKFHEGDLPLESMARFNISPKQIGGVYSTYATALIILEGDLDKAAVANDISSWYLSKGERSPVLYQRAAIKFLEGNYKRSNEILDDVVHLKQGDKAVMVLFFDTLINKYCALDKGEGARACSVYRDGGLEWKRVKALLTSAASPSG